MTDIVAANEVPRRGLRVRMSLKALLIVPMCVGALMVLAIRGGWFDRPTIPTGPGLGRWDKSDNLMTFYTFRKTIHLISTGGAGHAQRGRHSGDLMTYIFPRPDYDHPFEVSIPLHDNELCVALPDASVEAFQLPGDLITRIYASLATCRRSASDDSEIYNHLDILRNGSLLPEDTWRDLDRFVTEYNRNNKRAGSP
jgi:hypothetical protein